MITITTAAPLLQQYRSVRQWTEDICRPLQKEDYVVQPVEFVSPPKWHLGHSTWFFETLVLKQFMPGYTEYDPNFNFVFNSYYESLGARVIRTQRGNLSRPTVDEIYRYRAFVDAAMEQLLENPLPAEAKTLLELGCHHEQQHQELLWYDIKYILGHNPLFPAYAGEDGSGRPEARQQGFVEMPGGVYEAGFSGPGFCYDNELGRHKNYLQPYAIAKEPVTNGEYLEFIKAGGYQEFSYWHAEGWDWVKNNDVRAPLYWHKIDGRWQHYTLYGLQAVQPENPVQHVSFYEAAAFAAWKGLRLPTEFEWEAAAGQFNWGRSWEWTESAYLPYPGFERAAGPVGEYNGKFMVNQKVLRGASDYTPKGHSRATYRNFFHAPMRWQLSGIRLAKNIQ
ncbi:ergothioneine biosynthesis protein EgtB [Chitinophaga sp. GCM10012297]|uniref:Ergothioneine biosynthesis protein EgtB n=1 Tax=Chitinophaga chungangae TaxID=2821488 RepID=A0ABS3YA59_9BACT|nr:ergothioneine biosynthesis protein EgtB [Chitinophaga chungangae]MBO9151223.1 ergothioneine biosynthesis protein EgtB [Chitinophaga chungangae]